MKLLKSLIAILVVLSSPLALAELKIGYVDAQRILEQAPQVKAAQDEIEREFAGRRDELAALEQELQSRGEELKKNSLVLGNEEVEAQKRDLIDLQRRFARMSKELGEDVNLKRNQLLRDLQKLVSDEIIRIAVDEGYDLVVQDVVYASKQIDITDRVLELLQAN